MAGALRTLAAVSAVALVTASAAIEANAHVHADHAVGPVRRGGTPAHALPPAAAADLSAAAASGFAAPWASAPARRKPVACFAPGTTRQEVEELTRAMGGGEPQGGEPQGGEQTASAAAADGAPIDDGSRWTATATDGCCLPAGYPLTLTYSFVPDGTPLSGGVGEPASPSELFATMNRIYGSPSVWVPLFHQVFAEWGELTGIRYVHQPSDDGAPSPDAPGAIGVRGDVRIGGHAVDGFGGVLAYNWYPSAGDMVIDTSDGHFDLTDDGSLLLRNVVAHEHGHGIGLEHVCPIERTKLMEPVASTDFEGPQAYDAIAGQSLYGDRLESNDARESASHLGAIGAAAISISDVSIHARGDVDHYRFTVGAPRRISIALEPAGGIFREGPMNGDGSCGGGSTFDARAQGNLALDLLDGAGNVLRTSAAAPAGGAERITDLDLPAAGTYLVRVRATSLARPQLYRLTLSGEQTAATDVIFADAFESGDLGAWTTHRDPGGQLAVGPAGAIDGQSGLQIVFGSSASSYVTDRSPNDETRYRVRFRIDADSYLPATPTDRLQVLKVFSSTPAMRWMIILALKRSGGVTQIQARVRLDDGSDASTSFLPLADGARSIELDWQKASAPGASDGSLDLWIDGNPEATLVGLDNDLQRVRHARFGAMGASRSARGSLLLDGFESRRHSRIGP